MDRYIGLDVHAQSCTFAVIGSSGKRIKTQVVETNGRSLKEFLGTIPGRRHLCFEEGTQSAWVYEILEPLTDEIVVTRVTQSSGPKSDSLDAWALAEKLRTGAIETSVFKAPKKFTELREAVRTHATIVRELVRTKQRLQSLTRSRGLHGLGADFYESKTRGAALAKLDAPRRASAELLIAQLEALKDLESRAANRLLAECGRQKPVDILRSIPGIGPIGAAKIVATVVTPYRFPTKRHFWSYCGLAVVTRSSSDWVRTKGRWSRTNVTQTRGLTRQRNATLKEVFKHAAFTVATHMPKHPLHGEYQKLLDKGIKPNLAELTIARRIASVALSLWKQQEEYDPEKHVPRKP